MYNFLKKGKREKLGLDPYFKMLKEFGLKDVSITAPLTAKDLVSSIAKVLSSSLTSQAIMNVKFTNKNGAVQAYIEPSLTEPIRAGPVYRFGMNKTIIKLIY